jgi:hypothetical protein
MPATQIEMVLQGAGEEGDDTAYKHTGYLFIPDGYRFYEVDSRGRTREVTRGQRRERAYRKPSGSLPNIDDSPLEL